ncbi:MAG: hypothetical protein HRU14_07625 [Planctomycetes bacterium]|nr:hypothetical protein [Planctomycetota bacterium]
MKTGLHTVHRSLACALLILWLGPSLAAQGAAGLEARMPVKIIAGRLVARCDLSTRFRRIPVNLFIDYDRPCALELHNRAADPLGVDKGGGQPITVHLPGFNLQIEGREHGDEDILDDFTRLYSRELGENACVGTLGSKVLGGYHVVFDLNAGQILLRPPSARSGEPPSESEGEVVTSCTLVNDFVWVPVRLADNSLAVMNVGTSRHDSVVDEDICDELGKPAGDIGQVKLKTLDLHQYVAMRPAELVQVHPDRALGTLGLGILKDLRVEIDRVNKWVKVTPTRAPRFPAEDLAFFQAQLEEEPEPLLAWLEEHKGARLARECAELLLDLQIDTEADSGDFVPALEWMDKTRVKDLRCTEALTTMKTLLESRRPDVAIMAGEIGVKSGRDDRYPESVHKLHSKLGELMLEDPARRRKAWEHLLSAAFGLPEDGMINLHLGRFYELEERYRRAMSRYVQAVVQPESGPMAVTSLERLQQKMTGEPLSVDLIDQMIAGKVYNFGAATRFEPKPDNTSNRVVLVEFFTNGHFGQRLPEGWRSFAIGGAMAAEGLLSHYQRDRCAVLMYHVEQPEPTALMNALSMHMAEYYRDPRPIYTKVNGVVTGPGAEKWRKGEQVYEANRTRVLDALTKESDWTVAVTGKVEKGVVSGEAVIKGPAASGLHVQIVLAERGVLYPGKAQVVVNRMVARAALTGKLDGVRYAPEGGKMTIPFSKTLADVTAENEAYLDSYEQGGGKSCSRLSTGIDPRQLSIVAYIRNVGTREVLQAVQINPVGAEPREKR